MLTYTVAEGKLELIETRNGDDFEFCLHSSDPGFNTGIHRLRKYFGQDNVHTDVLFYPRSAHECQMIVRQDYYTDFLLQLFKNGWLAEVKWG